MLTIRDRIDCGVAFRGVHLPGYHVIPILLFGSRPDSGSYSDCGGRGVRPIHFIDSLVSNAGTPRSN